MVSATWLSHAILLNVINLNLVYQGRLRGNIRDCPLSAQQFVDANLGARGAVDRFYDYGRREAVAAVFGG